MLKNKTPVYSKTEKIVHMYSLLSEQLKNENFMYTEFRHLREVSRQWSTFHHSWPVILCTKQAQRCEFCRQQFPRGDS